MQDLVFADYEGLIASHVFRVSQHADQRMVERNISLRAVHEVLECYQPIEWWQQTLHREIEIGVFGRRLLGNRPYKIVVTGESEIARRPLCIVCSYGERPSGGRKWHLHILTVYDPSLEPQKWADGYTRRVCFCEGEQTSRLTGVQARIEDYYKATHGAPILVYTTP